MFWYVGVNYIGAGVRHHLALGHKVAANAIGATRLAEAAIELEEILGSILVRLAWCVLMLLLLYCILILLLNLKAHQIVGLRTCLLLVLLRVVLNKLHMLSTFLYIWIIYTFLIIYLILAVVLLR